MYLLCCDWGTSSLRLRLINRGNRKILCENISEGGVESTFLRWGKEGMPTGISKKEFFKQTLKALVQSLASKISLDLLHTPIVISGMASSSIGLKELPYVSAPFLLDGSEAGVYFSEADNKFPHDLFLVSGVCNEQDVMRGEETQLVGLFKVLEGRNFSGNTVFLFPGTHSKHIYVQDFRIVEFKTFITGEIFNLLIYHSLLRNAVESPKNLALTESENLDGFQKGVAVSASTNILNSLFTVRTNELFSRLEKKHNFFYLSGLLIGSELRSLMQEKSAKIVVCSGSNLYSYYRKALEELNFCHDIEFVEPEIINSATIAGQVIMFNLANNRRKKK